MKFEKLAESLLNASQEIHEHENTLIEFYNKFTSDYDVDSVSLYMNLELIRMFVQTLFPYHKDTSTKSYKHLENIFSNWREARKLANEK